MALTDCQMEILRLLKVLEVPEEKAIRAMVSVENKKRAEAVIDKLLEMEDNNEITIKFYYVLSICFKYH